MSIEIKDGIYTASFGARLLNGLATPSIRGSAPAAGWYHIQPPVADVVFGLVAVMTPVGAGGIRASDDWTQLTANKKYLKYVPGSGASQGKFASDDWTQLKNTSQIKFWDKSTPTFDKRFNQGTREEFLKYTSPGGGSASAGPFVISSRPIPGRNCLVIPSGFADLMDALTNAGGAEVRVF